MPNKVILSESKYAKLVRDVRVMIEEGRQRAAISARQELVQTYWKIGKRISEEGLTQSAGYNQAILADLATYQALLVGPGLHDAGPFMKALLSGEKPPALPPLVINTLKTPSICSAGLAVKVTNR